MTEAQEKKSRRIALISSIGVHVVILLLLLFVVAWRAPNPPLPEYGIELNFGTVSQGSGAVQPRTPAAAEEGSPGPASGPVALGPPRQAPRRGLKRAGAPAVYGVDEILYSATRAEF